MGHSLAGSTGIQIQLVKQHSAWLVPGWVTQIKLLGAAVMCIQIYYIGGSLLEKLTGDYVP